MNALDVCFSKSACWKIFDAMDGPDRSEESEHKHYDSDSGMSDDNDGKAQIDAKPEKDADPVHGKALDRVSGEYTARFGTNT